MEERVWGREFYDPLWYRCIPFVPKTRGLCAYDENGKDYWIMYKEGIKNISIIPGQFFYETIDIKNRYNYTKEERIEQLEVLKKYLCLIQGLGESDSLINYRYEVCEKKEKIKKCMLKEL